MDEKQLSLKIIEYLNKNSLEYSFKFIDDFCDLADKVHKIYIEVKIDHFAPAQILHALAKERIKDASFLGVADSRVVKLYKPPEFEKILAFATSFDPGLVFAPSQVDKTELNARANQLLGTPQRIIKLEFVAEKYFHITKDNIKSIRLVLDKYRIEPHLLLDWLDSVREDATLIVNKEGWLVNVDKPDVFTNESATEKKNPELSEYGGHRKPKHTPIRQSDAAFFESLRVRHEDLAEILHEVDRFLSITRRRRHGVFWTEEEIGDKLAGEILELSGAQYVVEPCVGGGSLIKEIVPLVNGAMNDIDVAHINNCERIFDGYNWKFTSLDVVSTQTDELIEAWGIPGDRTLLLYTNPPFGTVSTNRLVSTLTEMKEISSRRQKITYPPQLLKYGKGDLFLPIVGRLIEIARTQRNCYLAFFSPFGLFCGRERYNRLLDALLKEFRFVKGYVFAGNYFHDINQLKPIALSIWRYGTTKASRLIDLSFDFIDKSGNSRRIRFKELPLLKDGWAYDRRDKGIVKNEIVVHHCETFNAPAPKVFHLNPKQGGSEVIPENVIKPLGVDDLPDELVYALWSVSVGAKVFWTSLSNMLHPIYFDNAYVHLPDFSRKETIEILAYSALHAVLRNYAPDRIGFVGSNRVFRFGNERLTKGVLHLFDLSENCIVYDNYTVKDVLDQVKESEYDFGKSTKGIKEEVTKRLNAIGYWDYVPIPEDKNNASKTGTLTPNESN